MKTLLFLLASLIVSSNCWAQAGNADSNQDTTSSLTEQDLVAIAIQKICPVSGAELGSMGEPVKIMAGEQAAYLCCQGCRGKEISVEHWTAIQARIAKAQGICPIMEKPVDSSMESTVVEGRRIFVCCPPCIPKIQEDPDASMEKVKSYYTKFIAIEKQAGSDRLHAQAQGICPVSGQELGSMGAPVKVQVGEEEHAFLCCQGCVGKELSAEHWQTIQGNLAVAQGICPVMGQPVDATMESAVVNGRKIFVCCPPCIDKIKANPAGYVAMLDGQIANGGKAPAKGK